MTLKSAFENQAVSCVRLGSPFMGQLLGILAEIWPEQSRLGQYFATYTGDIGPSGASLPLRITGGLHALVLTGRAPSLADVYPPSQTTDIVLAREVASALADHEDFLLSWVKSPPQTNEVRRSAALMAGAAVARTYFDKPVWLSELGASGGLNLYWDSYALELPNQRLGPDDPALTLRPEWQGDMPPPQLPAIAARAGVDLNPLDPKNPADHLRLLAFLWPDQPDRLEMTQAAARAVSEPVERGDAIDWLAHRLSAAPDGHLHLIQNTVAWQYIPAARQQQGRELMAKAGAAATSSRPLAWLSVESDGDNRGAIGAAITLKLWPGDLTLDLGRSDFHGRWIKWAGHTP